MISFSVYGVLWGITVVGFPFFIILSVAFDLAKKATAFPFSCSFPVSRAYLFFILYLTCELIGLLIAAGCWIVSGKCIGIKSHRFLKMNAWLQGWWASAILYGAIRIFSMQLEIDDNEVTKPGPIILLVRHSSTADTVLAAVLVAKKQNLLLRYIFKKELLWDPCLDVVGNRLPNVFIDRSGLHTEIELLKIKALTQNMQVSDGLLLYPEGTRFSPDKLNRAKQKLKDDGYENLSERAGKMQYVLPPRPGGILTVLENSPDTDLVFCVHTGFEGASSFSKFFNGELIGQTIKVKFWRLPAGELPTNNEKRLVLIFDQWLLMDQWITEHIQINRSFETVDGGKL